MAVDLKKDWPIVAALGAGAVGVVLLVRAGGGGGTAAPAQGGTGESDATAQARIAAQAAMFQTFTSEYGQTERVRMEADAAVQAARVQAGAQASHDAWGAIGGIAALIFSWETTAAGLLSRNASRKRMEQAYGKGGWYEGDVRGYVPPTAERRYRDYGPFPYRATVGIRGLGTGA